MRNTMEQQEHNGDPQMANSQKLLENYNHVVETYGADVLQSILDIYGATYFEQIDDFNHAVATHGIVVSRKLRELYGVTHLEILELLLQLSKHNKDFRNGKLPLNEAEDITIKAISRFPEIGAKLQEDIKKIRNNLWSDKYITEPLLISLFDLKTEYSKRVLDFHNMLQNPKIISEYIQNRIKNDSLDGFPVPPHFLPPVIQDILKEGLLDEKPGPNGKYIKKGNTKDIDIIRWVFKYSGYSDTFTTALYEDHVKISVQSKTIDDYITRAKEESR